MAGVALSLPLIRLAGTRHGLLFEVSSVDDLVDDLVDDFQDSGRCQNFSFPSFSVADVSMCER